MKNMFDNQWAAENSIWFNEESSKFNVDVNSILSSTAFSADKIATAAEQLGANTAIMDSYWNFQTNTTVWFFSKNPNLLGSYKNVTSLKTWTGWRNLSSQHKTVYCDLAKLNANTLVENDVNLKKLIDVHSKWPQEFYAVFWGNENSGTWTCNIFVGEAIYWAGKNTAKNGKYYSASQIHSDTKPFNKVEPKNLKRGNIVTMHDGAHTEIVTKSPLKFDFADDGFCSIGAGRSSRSELGTTKCDSSSTISEDREINNSSNAYHSV